MADPGPRIVLTDPPALPPPVVACPKCGAAPTKRIDGSGFGRTRITLCGECGYEFQES